MPTDTPLLVLCQAPDADTAARLARLLVERRLAACVNQLAACRSVYRWEGRIEAADEVPLLIKTTQARYAALEATLRAEHPYELPEIIALPLTAGLPDYLDWIGRETGTGQEE
ncbi:MAG: divalent-cation tolerance protein CutA [Candidatus Dactylopiibacterium sp.]|nr:divalent-cation tolerance protein CutA [Candidatus Dactylopiibacterium sp.]